MNDKSIKIIAFMGLFIGPLYLPIAFMHLFSIGAYSVGEMLAGGAFAFSLIFLCVVILLGSLRSKRILQGVIVMYLLLGVELGVRLYVRANTIPLMKNKAMLLKSNVYPGYLWDRYLLRFSCTYRYLKTL